MSRISIRNWTPAAPQAVRQLIMSFSNVRHVVTELVKHAALPQQKGPSPFPIDAFSTILMVTAFYKNTKNASIKEAIQAILLALKVPSNTLNWLLSLVPGNRLISLHSGSSIEIVILPNDTLTLTTTVTNGTFLKAVQQVITWCNVNGYELTSLPFETLAEHSGPVLNSFWATKDTEGISQLDRLSPEPTINSKGEVILDIKSLTRLNCFEDQYSNSITIQDPDDSTKTIESSVPVRELIFHSQSTTSQISSNASTGLQFCFPLIAKNNNVKEEMNIILSIQSFFEFSQFEFDAILLSILEAASIVHSYIIKTETRFEASTPVSRLPISQVDTLSLKAREAPTEQYVQTSSNALMPRPSRQPKFNTKRGFAPTSTDRPGQHPRDVKTNAISKSLINKINFIYNFYSKL